LKKVTRLYFLLLTATIIVLTSCSAPPDINGLWQSTKDAGTIEFKSTGEVIIVDNMSATVTGRYEILEDNMLKFELTATDVMRDSVQAIPKKVITARIIMFNDDELQLEFAEDLGVEHYRRIR
jgi:hypothetical protein